MARRMGADQVVDGRFAAPQVPFGNEEPGDVDALQAVAQPRAAPSPPVRLRLTEVRPLFRGGIGIHTSQIERELMILPPPIVGIGIYTSPDVGWVEPCEAHRHAVWWASL